MNINHSAFKPFLGRKEIYFLVKYLQFVLTLKKVWGKKTTTTKQTPKLNKKYPTPQIQEIQAISYWT